MLSRLRVNVIVTIVLAVALGVGATTFFASSPSGSVLPMEMYGEGNAELDLNSLPDPARPLAHREGGGHSPLDPLRVEIWIIEAKGAAPIRYEGSGSLYYYRLSSGARESIEVEAGVAQFHVSSRAAQGVFGAKEPSLLYLESLVDSRGRLAYPVSSTLREEPGVELTAHFRLSESWTVHVLDGEHGVPLAGLSLLASPGEWTASPSLAPPAGARSISEGSHGLVELLPTNDSTTYWIGAKGYAWAEYRWQRRHHLGKRINLHRAATLDVECAEDPWTSLAVEILGEGGKVVESWRVPVTPEQEVPLPAGEHLVRVRCMDGAGMAPPRAWKVMLEPGQAKRLQVSCKASTFRLIAHVVGSAPTDAYSLEMLDFLGAAVARSGELKPDEARSVAGGARFTWGTLDPGLYVMVTPEGVLHPADLRLGDAEINIDPTLSVLRSVYFVEPRTDTIKPLKWVRWSVLEGHLDEFPKLFLPESGLLTDLDGTLRVKAPPGELRMAFDDGRGARAFYLEIDESLDFVVELDFDFRVIVSAERSFASAWLSDISFMRAGEVVPERDVYIQTGSMHSTRLQEATVVVVEAAPDAMYIPPLEHDASQYGRWLVIPDGARIARVRLGEGVSFDS
ncbi:MAG: hypothetical protein H0U67_01420 [Gemmatimonadetes bacterium]|nr:hypothetical protein [Gemmatimonadota bacterium]